MEWLQSFMNSVSIAAATFFTYFGEEMFLIACLGFIYWCYDKEYGKFIGTSIVIGCVANGIVKNFVLRRRPYFDNDSIKCLKSVKKGDIYDISLQGYSFPSGHSQNAVVLYGSLPLYKRNRLTTAIAFILPLLVGLSRIALGVHYPTDVLAGWAIGALILFVTFFAQRKVKRRWLFHLIVFAVSLLGIFVCKTNDYYSALGMMAGLFLAIPFEEKYVKFKTTKKPVRCILRVIGGFILFFAADALLKLPFGAELFSQVNAAAFAVRTVRYAILMFLLVGVYPMSFRLLDKKDKAAV